MKPDPAALQRWQDMRFGMFIHWGPVSLTHREIGWSRGAQTPIAEYDNLYKKFNPVKFNADQWAGIAKAAGMKYVVLTTKHHDGFCLFATKQTDYNIMNSPFGRDVTKELAEACRKQGLAFGAYYSVCDWHHPDFPLTSPGGKVRREKSDLDAYNRYLLAQIRELITNCGPLVTIWNDVPQMFKGRGVNTIKMVRELQPDILINNRTGDGGDYDTPEQRIGGFNMERPWESCMTISAHNHWAWGGPEDGVKPLSACLLMLIRAAGGDGNVLLNVGPTPEGVIEAVPGGPAQGDRRVAGEVRRVDLRHARRPLQAHQERRLDPQGQHGLSSTSRPGRRRRSRCRRCRRRSSKAACSPAATASVKQTRRRHRNRRAEIRPAGDRHDRGAGTRQAGHGHSAHRRQPGRRIADDRQEGEGLQRVSEQRANYGAAKAVDDDDDTRWATDAQHRPLLAGGGPRQAADLRSGGDPGVRGVRRAREGLRAAIQGRRRSGRPSTAAKASARIWK